MPNPERSIRARRPSPWQSPRLLRGVLLLIGVATILLGTSAPPSEAQTAPGCDPADACCTQCTVGAPCPNDLPFESYPDYATQRAELLAGFQAAGPCDDNLFLTPFLFFVEGECTNGSHFIVNSTGLAATALFYSASGDFLGRTTQSDGIDPICQGEGYYPSPMSCSDATLTEVHCSVYWPVQVGDPYSPPGTIPDPVSVPSLRPVHAVAALVLSLALARTLLHRRRASQAG